MKKLYLMRHAKSSWTDSGLADFDRPLNERGLNAARNMGKRLAGRGHIPDAIISSPAKRAAATAALINEAGEFGIDIVFERRIYEAGAETLLTVVAGADDAAENLMLVGHNPGTETLIYLLTGKEEPMATAAIAEIDLDIGSWKSIRPAAGRLLTIMRPKDPDISR